MNKKKSILIFILLIIVLTGCSSSSVNVTVNPQKNEKISSIALSPSSGILGDAIGLELMKYNYNIYDSSQTSSLMYRMNLTELEILQPQNLKKLKDSGADVILVVRTVSGYDNKPQSASVKLISTTTNSILAGATWQNGSAGQEGSIADRGAKKDVAEASKEIVDALIKALKGKE